MDQQQPGKFTRKIVKISKEKKTSDGTKDRSIRSDKNPPEKITKEANKQFKNQPEFIDRNSNNKDLD